MYRVLRVTTIGFGDNAKMTEQVTWQGSDVTELSRKYPPSEIFGADPLGHSEIEGGHIRTDYRFERQTGDTWGEIEDPRDRVTPVTTLEREIDAENRRLFPGDFEDGCEFCGVPSCVGECLPEWSSEDEDCLEETAPHAWFND